MNIYDVIVIGGGPGGYTAAEKSAEYGLKTALIEKDDLGGVCLNVGCIPSKSLLKNAEAARILRKDGKALGFTADNIQINYGAAVERSRKVSKRLNQGVAFLMKKAGVDVFTGKGTFDSKNSVLVTGSDGSQQVLTAKNIIIAAGSFPVEIPGIPFDGIHILNYRQAILQSTLPKSVVIIGGGAIGVEFATIWNSFGTEVTIVEMKEHLLPNEESAAGAELERNFKKQGIRIKTGYALSRAETSESGVSVWIKNAEGELKLDADQVLISVGFRPASKDLELDKAGIEVNQRGWIPTDEFCRTNVPGIFAIGDITGKILLAHAASAMGKIAAAVIAVKKTHPFNTDLVPHATYSNPQVASFGINEETAAARKIAVKVGKADFIANGKALGICENEGWVKIIVSAEDGRILGATMVGPDVCELLPELTLAARERLTAEEIAFNIHAHPTLSEVMMDAAENILSQQK